MQLELTAEFIQKIKKAIGDEDVNFVITQVAELHPTDISSLLKDLNEEGVKFILDNISPELGSEAIADLDEDHLRKFLKFLPSDRVASFVDELESDDAADILQELPIKKREETLFSLRDKEKAAHIVDLLHYEEDSAGGLMAKELIKANVNWTVVRTIEELRRQGGKVERIYAIYVVDDQDKLMGRVGLKNIILASDETLIKDIYDPEIIAIETYADENEVANKMQKFNLDALPVINFQGKLLGRVTIDDVVDVIKEQAELERQIMAGISSNIEEDDNIWILSRARLPWLMIGMFGGLAGAQFIGLFEADLTLIPAMAFFIPLITATGGNVGIQSSSIIVQSLANQNIFNTGYLERLGKVILLALVNGVILAIMVFGFNLLLGQALVISMVVSISLFSVILLSSIMGTFTPLVLDRFGFNPALASGPFITTTNDLLGLGVYFVVAHFLLGL
jgi:magnesium transporter